MDPEYSEDDRDYKTGSFPVEEAVCDSLCPIKYLEEVLSF